MSRSPLNDAVAELVKQHGTASVIMAVRNSHSYIVNQSRGNPSYAQHMTANALLTRALHHTQLAESL